MAATVKDVARLAGTSIATVSYVISGNRYVSAELHARVRNAATALGYQPSSVARGLREQRTRQIGMLLPDITYPMYPQILRGAQDIARKAGYHVLLCNSGDDTEEVSYYVEALCEQRVRGMIFTSATPECEPLLRKLQQGGEVPFVLVNRRIPDLASDFVGIDNYASAVTMMRHLLSLGYQSIGLIGSRRSYSTIGARLRGYEEALATCGLSIDPALIRLDNTSEEGWYNAAQELLALPHRPRAIFATNDLAALRTMDAAYEVGLRVPEDVAVVGHDDLPFASSHAVALTTMRVRLYELGIHAMKLLLERLEHPANELAEVILPSELVVRRTCGAEMRHA